MWSLPSGVLFGLGAEVTEESSELLAAVGTQFTGLTAYSFMIFNLLCAPAFPPWAIKREMNSPKWTVAAIGYMCGFAYLVSLMVYQFGLLAQGQFSAWTVVAFAVLAGMVYLLFRKGIPGREQPPAGCGRGKRIINL